MSRLRLWAALNGGLASPAGSSLLITEKTLISFLSLVRLGQLLFNLQLNMESFYFGYLPLTVIEPDMVVVSTHKPSLWMWYTLCSKQYSRTCRAPFSRMSHCLCMLRLVIKHCPLQQPRAPCTPLHSPPFIWNGSALKTMLTGTQPRVPDLQLDSSGTLYGFNHFSSPPIPLSFDRMLNFKYLSNRRKV